MCKAELGSKSWAPLGAGVSEVLHRSTPSREGCKGRGKRRHHFTQIYNFSALDEPGRSTPSGLCAVFARSPSNFFCVHITSSLASPIFLYSAFQHFVTTLNEGDVFYIGKEDYIQAGEEDYVNGEVNESAR